jgi:hypothetical protein
MGLIRSGAVIFFSGLLFLSIFLGNIFLTVSWSLEYQNIQPQLTELTTKTIEDLGVTRIITKNYEIMQLFCPNQEIFTLVEEGINLEIPCTIITQGPQQTIEYSIQESIKQIYYKDYPCEFWECVKSTDTLIVLISETAKEYWHEKFYLTIIVSIILFVLLFIFIESKKSALTITGALIIVASIPFRKINWILSLLPEGNFTDLFAIFFTRAYNVFLTTIIIGITIFLIGLAFEFFKIGIKLTNFFRWIFKRDDNKKEENLLGENEQTFTKEEIKNIVKKEIKKQKIKNNVKKIVKEELKENN